jgi:hypothetical protein
MTEVALFFKIDNEPRFGVTICDDRVLDEAVHGAMFSGAPTEAQMEEVREVLGDLRTHGRVDFEDGWLELRRAMTPALSARQIALLRRLDGMAVLPRGPDWHGSTIRSLQRMGMIEGGMRIVEETWWRYNDTGGSQVVEKSETDRQFLYRITETGRAAIKQYWDARASGRASA